MNKLKFVTTKSTNDTQTQNFTFPLMLDVILDIEVNSDISSDSSRPTFSNVGLGDLYY